MCVMMCVCVCMGVCVKKFNYGCQILGSGNLFVVVDLATKLQSMVTKGLTIRVDIIYQPHTKP